MSFESWLRKIEDDADHFVGRDLNARKKERLDSMTEACRKLAEIEPGITTEWVPFSNRDRSALVKLVVHDGAFITNQKAVALLGALYTTADDAGIVASGDDVILSFGIRDMWDSFFYDNDMEHGK